MSSRQNKSSQQHGSSLGHFSISKKAQLQAIRTTEQPILQRNGNINRSGYKFAKYFR